MLKAMIVAGAMLVAGNAFADEVVVHQDDMAAPTTSKTVVEHHDSPDGCSSKTVHKENDMGDSKTVKKTDC